MLIQQNACGQSNQVVMPEKLIVFFKTINFIRYLNDMTASNTEIASFPRVDAPLTLFIKLIPALQSMGHLHQQSASPMLKSYLKRPST